MDIGRIISNTQAMQMQQVVEESLHNTRDKIATAQREQMMKGESATGKIGKYKNPKYAAKKFAMNSLAGFGNVDLKLTGAFQGDLIVDVRTNSLVIDSGDAKAGKLISQYGADIFGLNASSTGSYTRDHLQPEGVKQVKQKILK